MTEGADNTDHMQEPVKPVIYILVFLMGTFAKLSLKKCKRNGGRSFYRPFLI